MTHKQGERETERGGGKERGREGEREGGREGEAHLPPPLLPTHTHTHNS